MHITFNYNSAENINVKQLLIIMYLTSLGTIGVDKNLQELRTFEPSHTETPYLSCCSYSSR